MGFHDKIAFETPDGKTIFLDLNAMEKEKIVPTLNYFLFGLGSVPGYTAKIFIDNAKLIDEKDFLDIVNRAINSEVAQKDTKDLLSFLRKIFIAKFNSLHFELLKHLRREIQGITRAFTSSMLSLKELELIKR